MNNPVLIRKHLQALSKPLEKHCWNCGDCCHLSIKVHHPDGIDRIMIRDLPCKFLKKSKSKYVCKVYKKRFVKAPWCQDLESLLTLGLAPEDCGYVRGATWYKGVKKFPDALIAYLVPHVIHHLEESSEPFSLDDVNKFLAKWS